MPSAIDTSVDIKITLAGKEVTPFNSLTISQSIVQHHVFEVRCYHEVFEDPKAQVISATQNIVGQDISISMKAAGGGPENIFKGIVTEVGMVQGDGISHEIILKGYSNTIKLEGGPKLKVYLEKTLNDIATEIVNTAGLKKTGRVKYSESFKYCAQYNESDFQFLRRLAAIHGEWFYYDGSNLVFGEPNSLSTVKLQYMKDLMTLSMGMGTAPMQFKDYSYNSGFDGVDVKNFNGASPGSIDGADSFGQKMVTASKNLFHDKFKLMPKHVANNQSGLENFSKSYYNSIGGGLVHMQASGDNPNAAIGMIADISTEDGTSYGKFLITSISHHCDGMGNYTNNFTGIPSTLKTLPNSYFQKPNASFEIAKVVDNVDPDKHGRVRVKFMWMEEGDKTWWVPTTQLYGGHRDIENYRGIMFIPEIDDDVIVGFEKGDCDKPYISQSLMNSKNIKIDDEYHPKNAYKEISTRDNFIMFMDKHDTKTFGIELGVQNGSATPVSGILMAYQNNNKAVILIEADDHLFISTNGKEASIEMNKDGSIMVKGKNINVEATETLTLKGKDIKMEASNEINAKATANIKVEATGNLDLKATQNLTASASMNAKLSGSMNASVEGSVGATLKGAMTEVDGSGMTTIKGAMVMIN